VVVDNEDVWHISYHARSVLDLTDLACSLDSVDLEFIRGFCDQYKYITDF